MYGILIAYLDFYFYYTNIIEIFLIFNLFINCLLHTEVFADTVKTADTQQTVIDTSNGELTAPPSKVDIAHLASDEEIRKRIQSILNATVWFTDPIVSVEDGVVFLKGSTSSEELRKWAGDLARNTQDVAAVANLEAPVFKGTVSTGLPVTWGQPIPVCKYTMTVKT